MGKDREGEGQRGTERGEERGERKKKYFVNVLVAGDRGEGGYFCGVIQT
jgi:hypothetical protein